MGSHIIKILFAFQKRIWGFISVAWSCARMQMPGFTEQSHNQMLLAVHTDE